MTTGGSGGLGGSRIYMDYAATAPLDPRALDAFVEASRRVGNPSSLHAGGRSARFALESSRERIAAAAGAHPSELIFTGSGTEADNLALTGLYRARRAADPTKRRILVTGIEHHAVLDVVDWLERREGAVVELVPVAEDGTVDLEAAEARLAAHPDEFALGTLMWANNEVGTLQPVCRFVELCASRGVPVHSDAVQALGTVGVDFAASGLATMAVSGHKCGAPVGIGALFVRRDVTLEPLLHGGGQERGLRSGTLDTAGAAAFAEALDVPEEERVERSRRLAALSRRFAEGIEARIPWAVLNGLSPAEADAPRLPGIVNVSFPGADGDSILFLLDSAGVQTSTGSACTAGVARPSHVVLAMTGDEERARGTQRFSLGSGTTEADVDALLEILPAIAERARAAGQASARRAASTPDPERTVTGP
ncbi:cysteine desulfurase family protein [Falsarthrobacter nasiphocae]|uniref:Cysteine desulfurase n=1 Tax=Falsarthrobacter nasiphocae TaxID=189863 RepID=A0AAE3YGC8_9MICC|nr:cysteine desulfurase family protein [Falsarthrobacter nasiphocae]MDR6891433.1 cysteine desulfurase [Falsarthrobacter nasiphocae]